MKPYAFTTRIASLLGAALIVTASVGAASAEGLFQTQTRSEARIATRAQVQLDAAAQRLSNAFAVLERKQIQTRTQTRTQTRDMTQDQLRTRTQQRDRTTDRASLGGIGTGGSQAGVSAGGGHGASGRN